MNYRTATILAATDLGEAGTKTIDLNLKDIVSRLTLIWKPLKSKHGMDTYAYKDITKIELVDGSDVLYSMDGGENQALCIYDRKCPTMNHGMHANADYETSLFGIDFGRYLYDPELAFDPTKFRNPQLKVTWDENVADTGVGANTLEILAECFDEKKVSPIGFLMSKEHWSGAPTAAGFEYIDLPTDHPIRKMLLKGYKSATPPVSVFTQARIDEDNEKRIPFNFTNLEHYFHMMHGIWRPVEETFYGLGDTAPTYTYYVTPTNYLAVLAGNEVGGAESGGTTALAIGGSFGLYVGATAMFLGIVRGYMPNHCLEFPFGKQDDPADWYDVTKLGSCRLRLYKGGEADSVGGVVLQQLRKY